MPQPNKTILFPSPGRIARRSFPTLLLLTIFTASLLFAAAPGVGWGQEDKGVPSFEELKMGRYGLDKVACILGLETCNAFGYVEGKVDLRAIVLKLIQVGLGFTSLIGLIFVLYGGFTWVTASGNSDKVNKGRDILIWAGIGLFVVMFAWGIITYVIYISSQVVS